jgi:hypothetical protein
MRAGDICGEANRITHSSHNGFGQDFLKTRDPHFCVVARSDGADFENLQLCSSHRPDALSREWDEILNMFTQSAPNAPSFRLDVLHAMGALRAFCART